MRPPDRDEGAHEGRPVSDPRQKDRPQSSPVVNLPARLQDRLQDIELKALVIELRDILGDLDHGHDIDGALWDLGKVGAWAHRLVCRSNGRWAA